MSEASNGIHGNLTPEDISLVMFLMTIGISSDLVSREDRAQARVLIRKFGSVKKSLEHDNDTG